VTGGSALCEGLGVTTAAGAAEVLGVGVGVVLGVAVGEVLGVAVGEVLGGDDGEVLGGDDEGVVHVAVGTNPPVLWFTLKCTSTWTKHLLSADASSGTETLVGPSGPMLKSWFS
jgi:hypothetical protein